MNAQPKPLQITPDNLLHWLRQWSREFGERPEHLVDGWDEGEGSTLYQSAHPLARAALNAPGSRQAVLDRRTGYRDGSERRAYMARDLAACGIRVVGMAYVDPVAGAATRNDLRTPRYVTRPPVPAEVLAIQRTVMAMIASGSASAWGHALQIHHCTSGDLIDKAIAQGLRQFGIENVRGDYEGKRRPNGEIVKPAVPIRAYRTLVEQAKIYLLGKLGA